MLNLGEAINVKTGPAKQAQSAVQAIGKATPSSKSEAIPHFHEREWVNHAHEVVKPTARQEGQAETVFKAPISHGVADGGDVHDDQPLDYLRVEQRRHSGGLSSHAVPDQHRL